MKTKKNITKLIVPLVGALSLGTCLYLYFSSAAVPLSYNLTPGMSYLYSLQYQTRNQTSLPMPTDENPDGKNHFSADIDIDATIGFRVYDKKGDTFRIGVYFEKFDQKDVSAMGKRLFETDEQLNQIVMGQEAILKMTTLGEVVSLHYDGSSHSMFKNLMQSLLGELQVRVDGDSKEWDTTEQSSHGSSRNSYSVISADLLKVSIDKNRSHYTELNAVGGIVGDEKVTTLGKFSIDFHKDGYLDSLLGKENISVSQSSKQKLLNVETSVSMSLVSIEAFEQKESIEKRIAGMEKRGLDDFVISEEAERQALKQQAAGMTVDRIIKDILTYGSSTNIPFSERWLWRAAGTLTLNPKDCRKLKEVFDNPATDFRGKNLVLELLAAAGHDEAQAVMVDLLGRKSTMANEEYFKMYQRLSVLERPNAQTIEFTHRQFRNNLAEITPMHLATTYTLAAMAQSAHKSGNDTLAKQYAREISGLLENTEDPRLTYHYLISLGATDMEENVNTISKYTKSENATLREAAAYALKDINTNQTENIVSYLLDDSDHSVQSRALQVLKGYDINTDTFEKIDEIVGSGKMKSDNFDVLMNLLVQKMKSHPEHAKLAKQTLAKLLEKEISPRLRYQLRKIVGSS